MIPDDRHFSTTNKAVIDTTTQYAIARYDDGGNFEFMFVDGWTSNVLKADTYSSPHRAQVEIEEGNVDNEFDDAFVVNVVTTVTKHRFGGGAVPRKATRG